LDEIGDLPLELQPKILRVMQERQFERLGGAATIHTDVRVICATHRNLTEMIDGREFRADRFDRLSVFPIDLPPLRGRADADPPFATPVQAAKRKAPWAVRRIGEDRRFRRAQIETWFSNF
jgi:transcriptional regulator with GAF, ATPase, and Fis domain